MLPSVKFKTNEIIDREEVALYDVYNFQNEQGRKEYLAVGVDGGSTHTRVNILSKTDMDPLDVKIIPSTCSLAGDEEFVTNSERLIDNMDSVLIDTSGRVDAVFTTERVLRGRKMEDSGLSYLALSTTKQKIKEKLFYINIKDAIGYALCMKYHDRIPTKVTIALSVALPPDDMGSESNQNEFISKICGTYIWKGFGGHIEIEIDIQKVIMDTEPHAYALGYWLNKASNGELVDGIPKNVMCINTGGRSTGIDYIKNSYRVPSASLTYTECGKSFIKMLKDKIVDELGGRAPSDEAIKETLKTGLLPRGNSKLDMIEKIEVVADKYGEYFYKNLLNACDAADIQLVDLNEIIVCGGLTQRGDYDISFTDKLGELVEIDSKDTIFTVCDYNWIPFGLAYSAFEAVKHTLLSNEEEDLAEEELEEVSEAE